VKKTVTGVDDPVYVVGVPVSTVLVTQATVLLKTLWRFRVIRQMNETDATT
jgi:hypothetical protein